MSERSKRERYIVSVESLNSSGACSMIHLALLSWSESLMEWMHGPALCGESVAQGEVKGGVSVECDSCIDWQGRYQAFIDVNAHQGGTSFESEADLRKALTDASAEIAELKKGLARAQSALPKDSLEHVGWYCWRCEGMVAEAPCRSDNVPLYVERSWAKDMVKEITRLQEEGQVNRNAPTN